MILFIHPSSYPQSLKPSEEAAHRTPSEREVNQLNQLEKSPDQTYEIAKNNESSTVIGPTWWRF